jgi:signal transduction histidine kinase
LVDKISNIALSGEKYKDIFNRIPIPALLWQKIDNDFILIDYNLAIKKVTIDRVNNFLGKTASEIYKDDPLIINLFNRCIHQKGKISEKMHYKYTFIDKDGTLSFTCEFIAPNLVLFYTEDSAILNKKGEMIAINEVKAEITRLKQSEDTYRKTYNHMKLYRDLFTHDINNIFQNILSSNELGMLYSYNPDTLQDYVEVANLIKDQISRGAKLVSNIKKLSELEEIEKPLYKTEILSSLNPAIESVKKSFVQKEINIEIVTPQHQYFIDGNHLLFDLYENILHNAVKHNKNQKIEIIININKELIENKNFLKIEFIDNGVGFPDAIKEIISKNELIQEKKTDGIGLGLLLIKRIVESYRGLMKIEDKVPGNRSQGSKFIIYFPEVV